MDFVCVLICIWLVRSMYYCYTYPTIANITIPERCAGLAREIGESTDGPSGEVVMSCCMAV